jgi:trimeric autotransporter adhesin
MDNSWSTRHLCLVAACLFLPQVYSQTNSASRIEENDPTIVYTGTWYSNHESPNSASAAVLTNEKGARAAITFNGTGITWIGVSDPYSGIAQVYLDGTLNTIDTFAPQTQYQQALFTAHGLAPGLHTLSIEVLHVRDGNTSGSWIWIDRFDIENGSGVAGGASANAGRVEQNDPSLSYTGTWFLNSNPGQSGGSAVLATDAGARATITFNGAGIRWLAYRDAWSGIANVYLDGVLQTSVDTFVAVDQPQTTAYEIGGLMPGTHSLTIEVTGKRNPQSGGSWVWVDAFDVR